MLKRASLLPAPASPYVAEWVSLDHLRADRQRWLDLSRRAVEPNPFYDPDYLDASARHLGDSDIRCIAVYANGARDSALIGLFPLRGARLMEGALIPALEFYRNDYICSTAPLVAPEDPEGVWRSFFEAFHRDRPMPRILLSRLMPTGNRLHAALEAVLREKGYPSAAVDHFARAAVNTGGLTYDAYLDRYSTRRRKDLRRRHRRLEEQGSVTVRTVNGGSEAAAALEDFLRIEASGWKGTQGTAMAASPQTLAFARSAFAGDHIDYDVLALDGKAIAVTINLVRGGAAYAVKTAYDEAFHSCSPGAMLDLHLIENVATGRYSRADSCAIADHPVESYWLEKQGVESLVFASHEGVTQGRIETTVALLRNFARMKQWVKDQIGR